jgi:cysteine synthase
MFDGLEKEIIDNGVYEKTVQRFRKEGIRLPKFSELANPALIREKYGDALAKVDPDAPDPINLFRVHWHNGDDRRQIVDVPAHVVLPPELTGVQAKIIVALGNRFPMIRTHKVLAAYGCLVPQLMAGRFDPAEHRAVWPSTGNYCRGGVAISRIMDCRGVAVLPEGMSQERFDWLESWIVEHSDIIRTPGSESNVKEIYDACHELSKDDKNIILNQFDQLANYITHRAVTGPALERVFNAVKGHGKLRAAAYIAASGSAGTLAAGDHLKEKLGAQIGVVEAEECPTLLYNGYGEHNIQGIGDKHIPFIHNVFNTDYAIAVSEVGPDVLNLLFNTDVGRKYLKERKGISDPVIEKLADFGLSSIANVLASIKLAKYLDLGPGDAIITVATDGGEMYGTEAAKANQHYFQGRFDDCAAAETFGQHLKGVATDHLIELDRYGRERIFNLGYYTWVEQQGVSLEDFDARRDPDFWNDLTAYVDIWDDMIDTFNQAVGQN